MALIEANQELAARDTEIDRLKRAFAFRSETIEKHNMLYEKYKDRAVGMPFCPRCLEVDGRYIKLTFLQKEGKPTRCPQCKSDYERQTEYVAKGDAKGD
jgi:rubrerythrin